MEESLRRNLSQCAEQRHESCVSFFQPKNDEKREGKQERKSATETLLIGRQMKKSIAIDLTNQEKIAESFQFYSY